MNIVYLLTNLDREEGRRFYVGSKAECFIENINGIDRIVSAKTGLPYYGSSSCPFMKEDMSHGHRFEAEILEEVKDKKKMLAIEDSWIVKLDAVVSPDYYNMSYARIGGYTIDQHAIYNMYGETIVEYGKATSSLNKKNNNAKRFGFKNLGDFCFWLDDKFDEGLTSAAIGRILGWEKHNAGRYVKAYNIKKSKEEWLNFDENIGKEIRLLIAEGVSARKIAELKGLEIPTVCLYIGDYDQIHRKAFLVAQRRGETKEELEIKITKMILDGKGTNEVSRELSVNETSVKRYFLRCVRRNLENVELI